MMVASCYFFSGRGWGFTLNLPKKIRPTITMSSHGMFRSGRPGGFGESLPASSSGTHFVWQGKLSEPSCTSRWQTMRVMGFFWGIFPTKTPPVLKVGKKLEPNIEFCLYGVLWNFVKDGSFERMRTALEFYGFLRKDKGQKGHGYMIRITVIWKRF